MLSILIVDDSKTIRKVVRRSLERYGYDNIEEAEDGLEATKRLETSKYDLIFTDINMPNMDGFELLLWMKEKGLLENTDVIAISTEVANMSKNEAQMLGIDEAIPKPFSKDEFEKIAISLLGVIEDTNKIQKLNLEYKDEIIITDDSTPMRSVLKRQLKVYGCSNIYEATNGKEALELINEIIMEMDSKRKIILFLDLNMPIMDGLELIEVLERKNLLEYVTIIVLSGSLDVAKATVDGENIIAALPKPFKQKEFSNVFTPLITASLLEENISFDNLKITNITKNPANMDDFLEHLFDPVDEQIRIYLGGYNGKKMIDHDFFDMLDSKIYSNYPDFLTSKQKKLLIGMKALKHLQIMIDGLDSKLSEKLFLENILPTIKEHGEKENEIEKTKKELKEHKAYLQKIEKEISKDSSNEEKYREKKEKLTKSVKIKIETINKLQKLKDDLYNNNYEQFIIKFGQILEESKEKLKTGLDRTLYRYDKNFWIEVKNSKEESNLKELKWLNSYTFLEDSGDGNILEKLKILDFSSILCVGFSQANSQKLKEQLSLYFKDFDITFLQKPDINFYTSPIEPNLVIIDYTIGSKKIEVFIKDTLRKYGVLNEDLNILYLLEQIPKKLDSTIASLLDKKKKNYIEFPKDRPSYRELCTKAKSLIS